jgi:adenosylhomocysteinase
MVCGRGFAVRAKNLGMHAWILTEVNHLKAIEAFIDGFEVISMREAAERGDIFVLLAGNLNV